MRRIGLFNKIFAKHLHKGKEPLEKFVEDVGALKGVFSYKGINTKTGKIICENTHDNLIVNQSKTAIIRLLGQGRSRYFQGDNSINTSNHRISKMRFSNDTGYGLGLNSATGGAAHITIPQTKRVLPANKYEYYALNEPSSRILNVDRSDVKYATAGGKAGLTHLETVTTVSDENPYKSNTLTQADAKVFGTYKSYELNCRVPYTFTESNLPPRPISHGSLIVKFYAVIEGALSLIEEIYFNYKQGSADSGDDYFDVSKVLAYNKGASSNKPYKIVNYKQADNFFYHVSTPYATATDFIISGDTKTTYISGTVNTDSRIYFDYTDTQQIGWKFILNEISPTTDNTANGTTNSRVATKSGTSYIWTSINLEYNYGLFNIINLIVPKTGYNAGRGSTIANRYAVGALDYYSLEMPTQASYKDSEYDFIDDYAVRFQTTMEGEYGNGDGATPATGRFVLYKKAFLHCDNDLLFSSITIPSNEFKKQEDLAYIINWNILAPID